jgi:hypothetical protein
MIGLGLIYAPPGQAAEPNTQGEAEWLIMMYMVADDETLEQSIVGDFNEAEFIGSSADVHIVAQVDRFIGAYDGAGDWTSAKRFYLTADQDFENIGSEELEDLGEVNMADGETLADFMTWAIENYPARKYALIMSDHGMGWPGGFADPDPGGFGADEIILAEGFGDGIWLMELDRALTTVRDQTGIDQLELIGFDVCLMGTLEVFSAVAPHARYAVASQEEEPGVGWAYAAFLERLVNNPAMDGGELGQTIVEAYIDQDLVVQAVPEAGQGDITLAAANLANIPEVFTALDEFANSLSQIDQDLVAEARAYAQPFNSPIAGMVDPNLPSSYIDLGNFVQLIQETSPETADSGAALLSAIQEVVIAEKHGPTRPGATGLTIEFPVFEQYGAADNLGYTTVAQTFTDATQWDEFLAFHHSGGSREGFSRPEEQSEPAAPELPEVPGITSQEDLDLLLQNIQEVIDQGFSGEEALEIMEVELGWPPETVAFLAEQGVFDQTTGRSRAARTVAKPIEMAPITLASEIATPDQPTTIQTEVTGDQIGYVYSFIGRFQPREDILIIEDMDYVFADTNQEVGGITRPVWPEGGFTIDYDWSPTVYAISDGTTSVRALFEPETYGETPTYLVKGLYTFADSGTTRPARISFREGEMTQVFVFSGQGNVGAPRQVTPNPGDTFTVLERGYDLSKDSQDENYTKEGGVLTFGPDKFFIEETPAPSGNYVVGFIAEDLQGRRYEQYEGLFVVGEDTAAVDGFVPYVNETLGFALLHPELWVAEADPAEELVDIAEADTGATVSIGRYSYPEATTPAEADDLAIQDFIKAVEADGELQNLQFVTETAEDYVLGAFDGKIFEFTFDLDGVPFYAAAVVTTPVQDTTYGVTVVVPDEHFDTVIDEVEDTFASFDVLISGVTKEQAGAPPPDFGEELFSDDFSDPTSGLFQDEAEQDWGRGYYAAGGQYAFELKPYAGPIYDYYAEVTLPDQFLLQATASYDGAANNAYGLVFQVLPAETEDGPDQFYTFRISGDGFYTVEKVAAEMATLIDWTATSAIKQEAQAQNVLTVEGNGPSYNLYINGQLVDSFTDTPAEAGQVSYSGGSVGFIVDNYDETAPASFTFDDLKVGTAAQ